MAEKLADLLKEHFRELHIDHELKKDMRRLLLWLGQNEDISEDGLERIREFLSNLPNVPQD
jgi:hypothetical protein